VNELIQKFYILSHPNIVLMPEIEDVIRRLSDRNLSEVSRRTGISQPTLSRIANNKAGNVGYKTIEILDDYLNNTPKE
jgi:transcriptional regulator with XRE-family HTH domain